MRGKDYLTYFDLFLPVLFFIGIIGAILLISFLIKNLKDKKRILTTKEKYLFLGLISITIICIAIPIIITIPEKLANRTSALIDLAFNGNNPERYKAQDKLLSRMADGSEQAADAIIKILSDGGKYPEDIKKILYLLSCGRGGPTEKIKIEKKNKIIFFLSNSIQDETKDDIFRIYAADALGNWGDNHHVPIVEKFAEDARKRNADPSLLKKTITKLGKTAHLGSNPHGSAADL